MFWEISTKGSVAHAISPYPKPIESEFDRSKQKGLRFQHVCNQDYGDWKWSQGLNKTMGVVTYLSTLGSMLKIIWCESVGRIVSGLIDIDPCSKTAKIHQGDLIGMWVWEGKCNVLNHICVYNIAWQCEIVIYNIEQTGLNVHRVIFLCLLLVFSHVSVPTIQALHVYLNAKLCAF